MNGNEIALDTNCAIAILRDQDQVVGWATSFRLAMPLPVLGELLFGAANSNRTRETTDRVKQLLVRCRLVGVTAATAEFYADIRVKLKRLGQPIPENDVWIAAACLEQQLALATFDAHFLRVPGLQVLTPP